MTKFKIVNGKLTVDGDEKAAKAALLKFTEKRGDVQVVVVSKRGYKKLIDDVNFFKTMSGVG